MKSRRARLRRPLAAASSRSVTRRSSPAWPRSALPPASGTLGRPLRPAAAERSEQRGQCLEAAGGCPEREGPCAGPGVRVEAMLQSFPQGVGLMRVLCLNLCVRLWWASSAAREPYPRRNDCVPVNVQKRSTRRSVLPVLGRWQSYLFLWCGPVCVSGIR